jgi:hypothetical protein
VDIRELFFFLIETLSIITTLQLMAEDESQPLLWQEEKARVEESVFTSFCSFIWKKMTRKRDIGADKTYSLTASTSLYDAVYGREKPSEHFVGNHIKPSIVRLAPDIQERNHWILTSLGSKVRLIISCWNFNSTVLSKGANQ